jgi:hypothetical protein
MCNQLRGFGQQGRRSQLKGFMRDHRLDILGLQETIKQEFSTAELRSLECGSPFIWNWVPADGHSGGMLLGFRDESFEVHEWLKGIFSFAHLSCSVATSRSGASCWFMDLLIMGGRQSSWMS